MNFRDHLILKTSTVREALISLDGLSTDAILFVVDDSDKLFGSLTDGDIRRGIIHGLGSENALMDFVQPNPKCIQQGNYDIEEIIKLRQKNFTIFPVLNEAGKIINVVNFRKQQSYLPIDAVIMAGGRGERLRPLTDTKPKPLLQVGNKPILEHNLDRLHNFGIDDIWITLRYMGDQIVDHFKDGSLKSLRINYVKEEEPLGTAGALSLISDLVHDTVLIINSDILTTINYEEFFLFFKQDNADLSVACIPYKVNVPYAVMDTRDGKVVGFKEKPTYTYYSNAGMYLMKREVLDLIPENAFYNATDLMEELIRQGKKVTAYPLVEYWLDIGKHDDYVKAQEDVVRLKL